MLDLFSFFFGTNHRFVWMFLEINVHLCFFVNKKWAFPFSVNRERAQVEDLLSNNSSESSLQTDGSECFFPKEAFNITNIRFFFLNIYGSALLSFPFSIFLSHKSILLSYHILSSFHLQRVLHVYFTCEGIFPLRNKKHIVFMHKF